MIKFRVTLENEIKEWPENEHAAALEFATINNSIIETITFELINENRIPDVTPRQFRQACVLKGISIASIEALINSLGEPTRSLAMIEWEFSIAFKRDNKFVNQLAPLLGLNSDALDDLWRFAATL